MTTTEDVARSTTPVAAATLTSSTTSVITWGIAHYVFHGSIPPEVFGWLQLVIPAALGWAGGWWAQHRQIRAMERTNGRQRAAQRPPG